MWRFAVRRLGLALAVTLTLSVVTFILLNTASDPAAALAGADASSEQIEAIRKQYGLDRPLTVQYADWLGGLLRGDLGQSWYWRQPVVSLVAQHAPVTILLALMAVGVTVLVALPLGIVAALRPGTWIDRFALGFAVAAQALPTFWFGLMAILIFSLALGWFPVSGEETLWHFVLPAMVLGLVSVPSVMRLTRAGLLDALEADFIRTARAKGLLPLRVLLRHALPNALLPVVSVLAVQLGGKLGGSVVTETVFAINGLGKMAIESIRAADLPAVQMLVFVFGLTFVLLNLVADLINAWLDPRIRGA
jgi:peptide/nickel transport system permease protein